jgi:hypothetical protein
MKPSPVGGYAAEFSGFPIGRLDYDAIQIKTDPFLTPLYRP